MGKSLSTRAKPSRSMPAMMALTARRYKKKAFGRSRGPAFTRMGGMHRAISFHSLTAAFLLLAGPGFGMGKTIDIELGKEFRLIKGEAARVPPGRALLKLQGFV